MRTRLTGPWLRLNSGPVAHCALHTLLQLAPKWLDHWTTRAGHGGPNMCQINRIWQTATILQILDKSPHLGNCLIDGHVCHSFVNLTVKTALKSSDFWWSYREQEGQHLLTGQRATNLRLLANQWAERRLVKQWRHGCRAMRRSVCNAGASNAGRFQLPLRLDIKGTELHPANILISLERLLIVLQLCR